MDAPKSILGKVISILFFKFPWYVFLLILLGAALRVALGYTVLDVSGYKFAPYIKAAWYFLIIVDVYVGIGLVLRLCEKIMEPCNFVDLVDGMLYKRSPLTLFAIAFGFILLSGALMLLISGNTVRLPIFLGNLVDSITTELMFLFTALFVIVVLGCVIKLILHITQWCPSCGKFFALRLASEDVIDSRDTTVRETHEIKNDKGEVVLTWNSDVPGVEETVRCVKVCKYCRSEVARDETRTFAK